ncbi:MAG TPA: DUF4402 domain-containing protein [Ferruginibacter sp.]|nr:DUF4402 domain-containing protein [Ferruginibacter sp.]
MKKTQKFLSATVAILFFAVNVNAQATATANASATIISPISISKTTDLNFGNLAVDATGGTVILDPSLAAIRTSAGAGGVSFPATSGLVSAAAFVVSGQANFTFSVNVLSASLQITNGTDFMTVDNFTTSAGAGTLSATGTQNVYVGADLVVAGSQAPGVYTSASPFTVLVNYN